ncbi:Curli production assembly/transport component CsgG [Raineya orbicola]|uniref:Curli production assembly/transport component CsgG n=2 Tax=Raineya orbicola TaxID=2016530 RepID=A0A2N3IK94_9BACT|nr:Curli production assembly/transport component CsgG [Raineya orbicola]
MQIFFAFFCFQESSVKNFCVFVKNYQFWYNNYCIFAENNLKCMKKFYFILIAISAFLYACSGAKSYYKKGLKLEQANMYDEASQMYLQSLARNPNYIDSKIALKKTGQIVFDNRLGDVFKAHNAENHKAAVYSYLKAQEFAEQVRVYNIELSTPPQYEQYFEKSKAKYLDALYKQATDLLAVENFEAADPILAEIKKLDPNYKDVKSLKRTSANEPLYRNGLAEMQAKNYKQAYYYFDQIYQNDKSYKDATALREKARKEAAITVSVLPFQNYTRYNGVERTIQGNVVASILALKSPFIDLVDRENLQTILDEQKFGLSGNVDEATAAKVGNLLGVKAVLIGKVTNFTENTGRLRSEEKIAYESYQAKEWNSTTNQYQNVTKYRRTSYREYYNDKDINITFEYQLISSETGRILASNVVNKTLKDEVRYGTYQGDTRNLFPGDANGVFWGNSEKNRFDRLFQARRELKPTSELTQNLYRFIADEVSADVYRAIGK